jgi:hypothetical protein
MQREGTRIEADDEEAGRLLGEPSRAEIEAACESIRESWSPRRLALRAGLTRWRLQSAACPFKDDGRPLSIE